MSAKVSILVVDDEPSILAILSIVAKEHLKEVDVRVAATAKEALVQIRHSPPDVLLADHRMPAIDGLQLLTMAREAAPNTRRLLMTSVAEPGLVATTRSSGLALDVLEKPLELDQVPRFLRQATGAR